VFYPYPDEYRFYPPDIEKLETVARETGGKVSPEIEDIFRVDGERASVPTALAPIFVPMALLLYFLDVAVRRAPWIWNRLQSRPAPRRVAE